MFRFLLLFLFYAFCEGTFKIKTFAKHKVFSNYEVNSIHSISGVECCLRCTNILDCFGVLYEDKVCKILSNVSVVVGYESAKETTEVLIDKDLLDNYESYGKLI